MTKIKAIAIAAALFASYPTVKKFHITTDGQGFENEHDANAHASFLDKKNPEVFPVNADEVPSTEKAPVSAEQKEVTKWTGIIAGLEKALAKAGAPKKPAIQVQIDEAKANLTTAEVALAASLVEPQA